MGKPRLLFVADIRGWAYDDAALNWQEQFADKYKIDIIYLQDYKPLRLNARGIGLFKSITNEMARISSTKKRSNYNAILSGSFERGDKQYTNGSPLFNHHDYDGLVFFYSKSLRDSRLLGTEIPAEKTAVWINNEKWVAEGAPAFYEQYLQYSTKIIFCNNQYICDAFRDLHPATYRATQGINPHIFNIKRTNLTRAKTAKTFIMGWSGDYKNPLKNIDLVKTCCGKAGVKLVISKNKKRTELNDWYNRIDAMICLSESEGGPLMLLESGACGLPLITKPVGLAREIIRNGENGILVGSDVTEIIEKIQEFVTDRELREKLGSNLYETITREWTYEKRRAELTQVFHELINQ